MRGRGLSGNHRFRYRLRQDGSKRPGNTVLGAAYPFGKGQQGTYGTDIILALIPIPDAVNSWRAGIGDNRRPAAPWREPRRQVPGEAAEEKETAMKLEDRLAVKLLAQAQAALAKALGETLCTEPDGRVIRALVRDAAEMIQEFEEQYFDMDEGLSQQGETPGR